MSTENDNEDINNILDEDFDEQDNESNDEEGEELSISFGDEPDEEDEDTSDPVESSTIRELRLQLRKTNNELAKLNKQAPKQEETIVLGEEPTLDSCEFDPDKYRDELTAYIDRKYKIEALDKAKENKALETVNNAQQVITLYEDQKKQLNAKNFQLAEDTFVALASHDNKGATILKAAKDKAKIVYALGNNTKKLDELLKINDPIELAAEVARIEASVKVIKRNNVQPEKVVKSNAPVATNGKTDKYLERLEKEAEKTGDRTKIAAYKREQQRNKK